MVKVKVAAAQVSSTYFDKSACLATAIEWIQKAAEQDVKLIVFPELFMPGYPFHLWIKSYGQNLSFISDYYNNSVEVDGPEAAALQAAAKQYDIRIVIGVSEKDHGSLYMSQWIISPTGELICRRKVKPTSVERTVFGEGDGSDIAVWDTEVGRIGALQCWEHLQPLFKHVMASQHEEIHCASWPCFPPGLPHFSLSADVNYGACMTYAVETGSYVVMSSAPIVEQNVDFIAHDMPPAREGLGIGGGASQIFDPEGRPIGTRPPHDAQALVIAEVDLDKNRIAKSALDPVGHYSRTDIFKVTFDNAPRHAVVTGGHYAPPLTGRRKSRKQMYPVSKPEVNGDASAE